MKQDYEYLDPDYIYTDSKTGVLRNKANIDNNAVLIQFESIEVAKRVGELFDHPIMVQNSTDLLKIHKYLFQDVYEWAGKIRTVEISKEGKQFFYVSSFAMGFKYIDNLINEYKAIKNNQIALISEKLAQILDNINYLHPFREGNGRTQREFIRVLALEKGLILNLNPIDNQSVFDRYMNGTIEGDVKLLADLIKELIESNR